MLNGEHSRDGQRDSADVTGARATAAVLEEEFAVPVTVYEAGTGTAVWPRETCQEPGGRVGPEEVRQAAAADRVVLTPHGRGGYCLFLPVGLPAERVGGPGLVAVGFFRALAATGPDAVDERLRLERWGRAVRERLCGAEVLRAQRRREEDLKIQLKGVWEVNLTLERLLRRLRVHKDRAANQERILEAAFPFLNAQALLWVPQDTGARVLTQGEAVLGDDGARRLAGLLGRSPELRDAGLLLDNRVPEAPWGGRFPGLMNLMAFLVPAGNPLGLVLALNKSGPGVRGPEAGREAEGAGKGDGPFEERGTVPFSGVGFRHADAAVLAPFAALLGQQARAFERYQDLKDLLVGLTRSLTAAVDAKDAYTYGHSERVARIALELGRELGLDEDALSDVYLAGLLHDIGKIGIRDAVLCKHGPLTPEEQEHIQQHVTIGHAILKDLHQIRSLLPGVLHHHERYDGMGYPDGLAGEQIPLLARILAVADAYDAMSTTRPYRKSLPPARVEEILAEGAGRQWDAKVIEVFQRIKGRLRAIRERGLGESLRQALEGALRKSGSSRVMVPCDGLSPSDE